MSSLLSADSALAAPRLAEKAIREPTSAPDHWRAQLIAHAARAQAKAYAPYSDVRIGAALLGKSSRIWLGANIGNSCSTLNCCAEQVAIAQAVIDADFPFRAIAIVQSSGELCPPCGRCRQLLCEFAEDMTVLSQDSCGQIIEWTLKFLMPEPFRRSQVLK